jgi:hypothetical protein
VQRGTVVGKDWGDTVQMSAESRKQLFGFRDVDLNPR